MVVGNGFGVRRERRPVKCMLYSAHTEEQRRDTGAPDRMALELMGCVPVHIGRAVRLSSHANNRPRSK
jgi:hypothetical protein